MQAPPILIRRQQSPPEDEPASCSAIKGTVQSSYTNDSQNGDQTCLDPESVVSAHPITGLFQTHIRTSSRPASTTSAGSTASVSLNNQLRRAYNMEATAQRPRRAPRCDYSYRDFENIIVEAVDDETDTTLSRKRKRTETKEPSALEIAFEEIRKAVSHKTQLLQEKNRVLQDELRQERGRHQKTQEELSRERRVLECRKF